jgi:hypothetical protein
MTKRQPTDPSKKSVWAYAYQIEPPRTPNRLGSVEAILEREQKDAGAGSRTWQGRLVSEEHVTHILVVSDSPAQDREVNRRLEAAFRAMDLGFTLTAPMPVEEEPLRPRRHA